MKTNIDIIEVYTDGSFIKKKNKEIFCGYGICFPDNELPNISKKFVLEPLTSQRAELYAIFKAIKIIYKTFIFNKLIIYSDSEYSIKSVSIWINNWKKNNWKTTTGKEVLNQDLIKKIDGYLQKNEGKILFKHVKAHSNNKYNDIADGLAKAGGQL